MDVELALEIVERVRAAVRTNSFNRVEFKVPDGIKAWLEPDEHDWTPLTKAILGWDPYAWHAGKPGKPRWRVRAGMAEERDRLCRELDELTQAMEGDADIRTTIANHNEWDRLKAAILACEEEEKRGKKLKLTLKTGSTLVVEEVETTFSNMESQEGVVTDGQKFYLLSVYSPISGEASISLVEIRKTDTELWNDVVWANREKLLPQGEGQATKLEVMKEGEEQ